MSSTLDRSRAYWDAHARRDPLWAILSEPSRRDANWDVDAFFQTGVAEIAALLYELDSHGIRHARAAALDFGCGVGRLTQALAAQFDHVLGIDVSPQMIELARQLNHHPDTVSYVANAAPDLEIVGTRKFDVLLTHVVLQHIEPDLTVRYLSEFFRVTRPGGLLVFQWPSHQRTPDESRPAAPRVMPDAAYRMSASIVSAPARVLEPGEAFTMDVEIANTSPVAWDADAYGAISAGNHWTDESGRMVQRDDGRTRLPGLAAGGRSRLLLAVLAPPQPGVYHCEIDLAHEGVLWFSDRGATPARLLVRVGRGTHADAYDAEVDSTPGVTTPSARTGRALAGVNLAAADPGEFPMHGRPRHDVEQLIARHGGALLHVEPDRSCGSDWVSYRYYVRNGP